MSVIDIVGLVAGLFFFYLGYLTGPLQWRMARKASRAIERMENADPTELENMRQVASSSLFFSPMSVLFFVIGMLACFPLARVAVQKIPGQQLHLVSLNTEQSELSNAEQSELSNAEQSLLNAADPKVLEDAYRRGMQALKMKQYAEAEKGIRQAALGGMSNAQFSLATLYENGFGLPKDGMQACYWYRVAADNKNINAQKALTRPIQYSKDEDKKTWEEENC